MSTPNQRLRGLNRGIVGAQHAAPAFNPCMMIGRSIPSMTSLLCPYSLMKYRSINYLIVIITTLIAFPSSLQAQDATTIPPTINAELSNVVTAYFSTSNPTPRIGEPFTLTLTVELPAGVQLVSFPTLPEDMLPLKILVADAVKVEGQRQSQSFTVAMWGAGPYTTPELPVTVFSQGRQVSNPIRSVTLTVSSEIVDPQGELAPRPERPPRDVAYVSPVWIGGALLALLIIAWLVRRFIRRESRRVAAPRIGTPAQIALAQLEDLKAQKLSPDVLYPLVADHLRTYLQARSGIIITDLTTQEIMSALKTHTPLTDASRRLLEQILEQADLVKFARFAPDDTQGIRYINAALRWLGEAEAGWIA